MPAGLRQTTDRNTGDGAARFEAPDGSFSVAYPSPGSASTVKTTDAGVTATYTGGDGGVLQLFSEPAKGRSASDIVAALVKRTYPDAKVAYEIPNAMVGYQPGYGNWSTTGRRAGPTAASACWSWRR